MKYYKIQTYLNYFGIDIRKYPTRLLKNRLQLLKGQDIDLVLDVGANIGQYGLEMRRLGYSGKILSFEPIKSIYSKLNEVSGKDINWITKNFALGDFDGNSDINISRKSPSSSILEMLPSHLAAAPSTDYIRKESIQVHKLDTIFPEIDNQGTSIFLKLDVQGFEKHVLAGAKESLKHIRGLQVELALTPLYKGEISMNNMILYLKNQGFELMSLEPGLMNLKTGQLLQADGIFIKNDQFL